MLSDAGNTLVVVTNQSAIGRGMYTQEQMHELHAYMQAELEKIGVSFAVVAYCPDAPEVECDCRKPSTGMMRMILPKVPDINFGESWMIGDKMADVGFGKGIGVKTAWVRSRYSDDAQAQQEGADMIVDSLYEFAQAVIA